MTFNGSISPFKDLTSFFKAKRPGVLYLYGPLKQHEYILKDIQDCWQHIRTLGGKIRCASAPVSFSCLRGQVWRRFFGSSSDSRLVLHHHSRLRVPIDDSSTTFSSLQVSVSARLTTPHLVCVRRSDSTGCHPTTRSFKSVVEIFL